MFTERIGSKVCIVSSPNIYEPYDLVGRIGKIIDVNIINKTTYGVKLDCGLINAGRDDGLFCLNENNFCVIFPPQKPSSLTNDITYINLKEKEENENMAALTGYKAVAVIKQGCYNKDYHFAIYEDGTDYKPGDMVKVSGGNGFDVIKEVITPEEVHERFKKNITAEVICKVDTTAYDERVRKRKEAADIKKEMDKVIKQMDEKMKYEIYAEENPDLKDMLRKYMELTKEV